MPSSSKTADPRPKSLLLAQPRGFCAGVLRAIEIVERALDLHGAPVHVLHEIVHNSHVVEGLRRRGAVFVETVEEIPRGAVTILSAHGVSTEVERRAQERELRVVDATCPLVTKVHSQAQRYHARGLDVVVIGHAGHPEVEGTRGRIEGRVSVLCSVEEVERLQVADPERLAYVTQTTLSVDDTREVIDALKRRFPTVRGPELSDICYATQNRQNAVRALAGKVDVLLVVGARNSSNSTRLAEVGRMEGLDSYLIQSATDLDPAWFAAGARVGVSAGASAPEWLVQEVVQALRGLGVESVDEMDGERETVVFPLPPPFQEFPAVPRQSTAVAAKADTAGPPPA